MDGGKDEEESEDNDYPLVVNVLKVDGRDRAQLDVENTYIDITVWESTDTALTSHVSLNYPFVLLYI